MRSSSSMCTGVYTAEMALATAANVVNRSGCLPFTFSCHCLACWAGVLVLGFTCYCKEVSLSVERSDFTQSPAQEIEPKCYQCIMDNHSWVENALQRNLPMPCLFGDMTELVPHGGLHENLQSCLFQKIRIACSLAVGAQYTFEAPNPQYPPELILRQPKVLHKRKMP